MNLGGAIRINKTGFFILILILVLVMYYYSNNDNKQLNDNKKISLRTLLSYSIKACKIGGIEVVQAKNNLVIKNKGKTKEGADDSYTTADVNSHCSMVKLFKNHFPSVDLISEEHKAKCDKELHTDNTNVDELFKLDDEQVDEKDVTIWIDPLDATQEYTEGLDQYVTTMVCIAVKGKAVIGVIHNPFSNETYWAWVDKGTSPNLQHQESANEEPIKIVISRSHAGKVQEVVKKNFENEKFEIIPAGGAGYKILQVVTGKADVYIHITEIKKWDICAGDAVLTAVHGKLSTKYNSLINYSDSINVVNKDGVIASLKLHDKFVGKI